jgi:hypothetical protein
MSARTCLGLRAWHVFIQLRSPREDLVTAEKNVQEQD